MRLVIEIKERDGKYLAKCREEGLDFPVGLSGRRDTSLAAAKRSLGNYFHLRGQ